MSAQTGNKTGPAGTPAVDAAVLRGGGGRRRTVVLIAAVLIVAVLAAAAARRGKKPAATEYKTEEAVRGDLRVIVTATGTLQPTNTVEVGSEISGIIKSVEADYNDRVKVNRVLARMDTSKLESQRRQSAAALEAAEARVLQSQATVKETAAKLEQFRRVRELSAGKVPSQTEMDAAEAALARARADEASAKAAVAQAAASLASVDTDLSKAVIRSPVNGVVLARNIEPGQTVAASFQAPVLFTLAEDLTRMELQVNVDEADMGKVREGQEATFTVDAYPNRTFCARTVKTRFGAETVDGVVTYKTILNVANNDLALRPGMTATADIVVRKLADALLVPNAALRFTPPAALEKPKSPGGLVGAIMPRPPMRRPANGGKQETERNGTKKQVWTLVDGKPTAVAVTIGDTNGTMTEIVSGDLRPGTAVVIETVSAKK